MKFSLCLLIAVVLFTGGLLSGILTPLPVKNTISDELNPFQTLANYIYSLPPFLGALAIFLKNAIAITFSFFLSPVFCLLPGLTLIINGWIVGYISMAAVRETSLSFVLAGLLPHGIIEIPAMIIGEAAALSFGSTLLVYLIRQKTPATPFHRNLKYLLIAILLLFPAAFIERYLTPLILNW